MNIILVFRVALTPRLTTAAASVQHPEFLVGGLHTVELVKVQTVKEEGQIVVVALQAHPSPIPVRTRPRLLCRAMRTVRDAY